MNSSLFSEFNEVSTKQWKQKIQYDLKGADYNKTLIWDSNEGIHVKPFYNKEDLENTLQSTGNNSLWRICQSIFVSDAQTANRKALSAIDKGAESIKFIIPNRTVSINDLLSHIDTALIEIHFDLQFLDSEYVKQISISTNNLIHIQTDIIGNLTKTGNWYQSLKEDHIQFENSIKNTLSLSIDNSLYQNAGATMVQQLAYAMAHVNEYLNHINNTVISRNEMTWKRLKVIFNVSIGSNYFFEIAKLKALRFLYRTLASEFAFNAECFIFATPTRRNKTLYDYNTNMLRTTTECMSAILGGANTICNLPYDAIYHKDNEFAERIARNQLLILKNESYFDKVNNPSDGAYYIEILTGQLAEKALLLFKDIEKNGGFLHQLKQGTIQKKIKESAAKEQEQFNIGEDILLGTNKHKNPNDKMKDELELYPFVKTNKRKTLVEPIIAKRLSETIEQERLKTE
ncbi:methylmalonyl-CoA mutase subunit beta [Yeosuana sp. MJ-SS3]|uniref:Methylmalonyl-CoA mutase subunit beta n=1 Tax=Gilvirhabdus luticola TaxID=3079858 RepID=A0ABU3U800_9FLAO|nr:methylmalonyl-CoA mutase subunit beta [Yeosuana sp. MJ-SS3]MDU8886540.1 methylmalonyl-CoA mutase subunit beta [Yeosuana sp. MJ-SS3]